MSVQLTALQSVKTLKLFDNKYDICIYVTRFIIKAVPIHEFLYIQIMWFPTTYGA